MYIIWEIFQANTNATFVKDFGGKIIRQDELMRGFKYTDNKIQEVNVLKEVIERPKSIYSSQFNHEQRMFKPNGSLDQWQGRLS